MNKCLKIIVIMFAIFAVFSLTNCGKNIGIVEMNYHFEEEMSKEQFLQDFEEKSGLGGIADKKVDLSSSNNEIIEIADDKIKMKNVGNVIITIKRGFNKYSVKFTVLPKMVVSASDNLKEGGAKSISIKFLPDGVSEDYTMTSSNEKVVTVYSKNKIKGVGPGTSKITIISESGSKFEFDVTVIEAVFSITYDISKENLEYIQGELPVEYTSSMLPLELPNFERDGYAFYGWQINPMGDDYTESNLVFELPDNMSGDAVLRPIIARSCLELRYDSDSIISEGETTQLESYYMNVPDRLQNIVWESTNEDIAVVDQDGKVTGIKEGVVEIFAYLKDMPEVNMTINVTVQNGVDEMNDLIQYLKSVAINEIVTQVVIVSSSAESGNFISYLYSGASYYLFEELTIKDGMVQKGMSNRPGDIYEKKYITVHDTANGARSANAEAHSGYVQGGGGGTSWHYTVGNDGIYHHIPDNENAYHAGDGGRDYKEIDTGIKADPINPYPVVTISKDGYYEIAGQKTSLVAPLSRPKKCPNGACGTDTKDGEVACSKCGKKFEVSICTNDMINTHGIRTGILNNGNYYIGNTYFNTTYRYISNAGGNDNAIGIEMCVNEGSDIFFTWQRNAKLVAKLMLENNLTINDVKPHHFFSGKDCPATMLHAEKWDMFIKMIETEYKILKDFSDYKITFTSHDPQYLNSKGKVIKQDALSRSVSYTITVEKDGVKEAITLNTVIPGRLLFNKK